MNASKSVRIGCASGFWGDSEGGAAQLVKHGDIDYLIFDYLAEITMSILARAKVKNPELGYATDFVKILPPLADEMKRRRIKVVANAGGINPRACRSALESQLGADWKIAVVEGDDLSALQDTFRAEGVREMFSGLPMPARFLSVNAYLGAVPIMVALAAGADIVIVGRCVDSALTLAPLMFEFGWRPDDYERLAQGSLAGHIIECGVQATGGLFTDWESVAGWEDMGFPIVECQADGSFVVTKPAGTGGLVTPATVAEQLVYEIGDPARYLLPDVTCDFTQVHLTQVAPDRIRVSGAQGFPPPSDYKVSATWADGWRVLTTIMIGGIDAARKAERVAAAIFSRTRRMLQERGWPDYTETSSEILGAESTYGPHSRIRHAREVVLKIAARHGSREALELLAREIAPSASAMAPGITGFAAGRAAPAPVVRLYSFLVNQARVPVTVNLEGRTIDVSSAPAVPADTREAHPGPSTPTGIACNEPRVVVPLVRIAHGRSGDKGNCVNIGLIARKPELYPVLTEVVTEEIVANYFAHVVDGPVTRYLLPGICGMNFLMERALGGGGVASLRYDPQGKAFAQMLLDLPLAVPSRLLTTEDLAHAVNHATETA